MEEEKNLFVCERCLWGIESKEGKQMTIKHYVDDLEDEDEQKHHCEWCGNEEIDVLYELV